MNLDTSNMHDISLKADNIIIDGNSLFVRSGYGFKAGENKEEEANEAPASFVFLKALRKYIEETQCSRVFLTFDCRSTFRYEKYPAYKADRLVKKEDPRHKAIMKQLEEFQECAMNLNCHYVKMTGYEADDTVFALSKAFKNQKNLVITGDIDLVQCCSENTRWYDPGRQRLVEYRDGVLRGREAYTDVKYDFKGQNPNDLTMDQFNLIKAISAGDDNIKGIPRYGWKTASKVVLGSHKKIQLSELYDMRFPRAKSDPTYEPKTAEEIESLNEEDLESYLIESTMTGADIIDRNSELMVIDKHPSWIDLIKNIPSNIKKGNNYNIVRMYLAEKKMYSLIPGFNSFIQPFTRLK